jgi:predicted secreted protein
MSNAVSGVGTVFKRSDMESAPTFSAIAEINSIDGPNKSRDTIDVTSLDSTGGYREFIASFRDGGEVSLEMNFTRDGYVDMNADFEVETLVDYQIVLPDSGNTTLDFSGLVTSLGLGIPLDDKITAPVTIKVSGQVTLSS